MKLIHIFELLILIYLHQEANVYILDMSNKVTDFCKLKVKSLKKNNSKMIINLKGFAKNLKPKDQMVIS